MAKVENFLEHHGGIQRNVPELLEYFSEFSKGKDISEIVIVFRIKDSGVGFICGSETRDYNLESINWDLDQIKVLLQEIAEYGEEF